MKTIALLTTLCLALVVFAFSYTYNLTADVPTIQGWVGALIPPVSVVCAYVLGRIH